MTGAYRCYFLDQDYKISWFQDIGAGDDLAAISAAKALAAAHKSPAFELWRGLRLVHREG
jgi:hypothetical protein